jgi:hypothetical protein
MTIETLKNLPLVENQSQPLDTAVVDFYRNSVALGTGPNGTYLLQDFFGLVAGIPGNQAMIDAIALIESAANDGSLADLAECYFRMTKLVDGDYGGLPSPSTVIIPAGPGAGTYADLDEGLQALIDFANTAIGTSVASGVLAIESSNTSWTALAKIYAQKDTNLALASIDFATMSASAQLPVTAFIIALASYGQDTQKGMAADILEALADTSTQAGQAMIGAMREGRNDQNLDAVDIGHDNGVPDQPQTPPPQATLLDSQYTVAEARARTASLSG